MTGVQTCALPICARVPGVAAGGSTSETDLFRLCGRSLVERGDVVRQGGLGRRDLESNSSVVPCRVARESESSCLLVIREPLGGVCESNAVGDDVVGWSDISGVAAPKLEAISVTLEVREAPAVVAIAPGDGVLDGERRLELPVLC